MSDETRVEDPPTVEFASLPAVVEGEIEDSYVSPPPQRISSWNNYFPLIVIGVLGIGGSSILITGLYMMTSSLGLWVLPFLVVMAVCIKVPQFLGALFVWLIAIAFITAAYWTAWVKNVGTIYLPVYLIGITFVILLAFKIVSEVTKKKSSGEE